MFVNTRRLPLLALAVSGLLWGTTVPLTKLALSALDPGWLTVVRFLVAAIPLSLLTRRSLRAALVPAVAAWGVVGYGLVILLQSVGIQHTSVSHAALLAGGVPALVALLALLLGRGTAGPRAWTGYALALAGIALVASAGGGGSSADGDGLVLASLFLSAGYTVAQPRLLAGRDPAAVTAVQFMAAGVAAVPIAAWQDGTPAVHGRAWLLGAVLALIVGGTLAPFTLFAWGQARTTPEVAGSFLNLEPVVGAGAGALAFGDPFGRLQVVGAAAVLGGIALTALPRGAFAPLQGVLQELSPAAAGLLPALRRRMAAVLAKGGSARSSGGERPARPISPPTPGAGLVPAPSRIRASAPGSIPIPMLALRARRVPVPQCAPVLPQAGRSRFSFRLCRITARSATRIREPGATCWCTDRVSRTGVAPAARHRVRPSRRARVRPGAAPGVIDLAVIARTNR